MMRFKPRFGIRVTLKYNTYNNDGKKIMNNKTKNDLAEKKLAVWVSIAKLYLLPICLVAGSSENYGPSPTTPSQRQISYFCCRITFSLDVTNQNPVPAQSGKMRGKG